MKNWVLVIWVIFTALLLIGLLIWGVFFVTDISDKISIFGIVAIVVTIFTSLLQISLSNKQAKEREYYFHVLKEKQKVYEHFYNSFFESLKLVREAKQGNKQASKKVEEELMLFKQGLMNWGSERLIQKYIKYDTRLTETDNTFNLLVDSNNFLKEIRTDMGFEDSKDLNVIEILLTAEARKELISIPD